MLKCQQLVRTLALAALLAALLSPPRSMAADPAEVLPAGITVQNTDRGTVYADRRGLTLYTRGFEEAGKSGCTSAQFKVGTDNFRNVKHPLMRADNRPTCIQKHPPAVPPAGAVETGNWSILVREDGVRQWMYERRALYLSVKDWMPGQVNGTGRPLFTPNLLPPGLALRRLPSGGVYLANAAQQLLFAHSKDGPLSSRCMGPCAEQWKPILAPDIVLPRNEWGVVLRADGLRQWAYRGQPLYYFAGGDARLADADKSVTRSWAPVSLIQPVSLPSDFSALETIAGRDGASRVVTTKKGMTVYTFTCLEDGPDRLDCDDPGDASPLWTTLCGGVERCGQLYRPVVPSGRARADGKVWSIVTISQPWSPVRSGQDERGIKVWAYRGKPVFTFAKDRQPGDTNGEIGYSGRMWTAIDAGKLF